MFFVKQVFLVSSLVVEDIFSHGDRESKMFLSSVFIVDALSLKLVAQSIARQIQWFNWNLLSKEWETQVNEPIRNLTVYTSPTDVVCTFEHKRGITLP